MSVIRNLLVVLLIHTAIASDLLDGVHRCKKDDNPCLTTIVQNFLRALIENSFEPFQVDHIEHTYDSGEKVAFSNMNISGLKNVVLSNLKFDTITKDTGLTLDSEPEIVTDIQSNEQTSKISMKGKIRIVAEYKYSNVPNAKGEKYFMIGPNTLRCEPLGDPEVSAISGAGGEVWEGKSDEMKILQCEVSKVVFQKIINSLRENVKQFPSATYFSDLD
ncbi:hypothetical protein NE865_12925 [Phthorimaea operculella]|nr:hypothetical protein NE865_12925 [Phthorimaea operculella]